jgi:hypothetical protein
MRALYFLLAGAAAPSRYLQPGLAVILSAVAVKMLLADVYKFPTWASPAFIAVVLAVVTALTVRDNRRRAARPSAPDRPDQVHAASRSSRPPRAAGCSLARTPENDPAADRSPAQLRRGNGRSRGRARW